MTNSFDIKLLGTHRRELVPVGGPRNGRLPRSYRDTRGHDRLEVVLTFEGGGGGGLEATAELKIPQSFEANPLRGASQANGGRCCPHSYFLNFYRRPLAAKRKKRLQGGQPVPIISKTI
jgi:hypothetical protein